MSTAREAGKSCEGLGLEGVSCLRVVIVPKVSYLTYLKFTFLKEKVFKFQKR